MSEYSNSITIAKVKDGQPGTSYYTYIKYSTDSSGNPMVDTPTDATIYIGIYTGASSSAPSTYTSYTWSRYTGENGERGGLFLKVTTAPSSYTTKVGDFTPSYRISKNTVITQSGSSDVKVGDVIEYSYYHYPVGYVDSNYVYTAASTSIRGEKGDTGSKGDDGDPGVSIIYVKELYYCTSASSASAPSQPVTETGVVYNTWTQTCPPWTDQSKTYFTCSEIGYQSITAGVTSTWASWTPVISNGGYNTTTQAAVNAQTSAGQAASAAQLAQSAANAAATSASNAQSAATNAQTAAQNAATSASNAQTAAQNAATSASQAATSASQAVASANQAVTAASEAKTSAQTAYNNATSAVSVANSAISAANSAIGTASSALDVANSKITTFYSDTAPTATTSGDLWFNTSEDNRVYRWTGTSWIDATWDIGINYLPNSEHFDPTKNPFKNSVVASTTYYYDNEQQWNSSGARYIAVDLPSTLINGSQYVFSFEASSPYSSATSRRMYLTLGTNATELLGSANQNSWTKFSKVFSAATDVSQIYLRTRVSSSTGASTYRAAYRNFKLEIGDKATEWTPAQVQKADVWYYNSSSSTSLSGDTWHTTTPTWTQGSYIWTKTVWTYVGGATDETEPACITGNTGAKGEDGAPGDAVIYEIETSNPNILRYVSQEGDSRGSVFFSVDHITYLLNKITNGVSTKVNLSEYTTNIDWYGLSGNIDNFYYLLSRLQGHTESSSTLVNLLTVGITTENTQSIQQTTFNFNTLLSYIVDDVSGNDSTNIEKFNKFKKDLNENSGCFLIRFYKKVQGVDYPTGSSNLIIAKEIDYGQNLPEKFARFEQTAVNIQAAVDETKLIFDANGLTIQDGGISIIGEDNETLLSYNQLQDALYIKGNGVFSGRVEAREGYFEGSITAKTGSVGGFEIGTNYIKSTNNMLILNSDGSVTANNISLGTSARIANYLQLGEDPYTVYLKNPNALNDTFLQAGAISMTYDGKIKVGNIIIDATDSNNVGAIYSDDSISSDRSFKISPDLAVFNNVNVRGKISSAVYEYAKVQSVGGIMMFKPSFNILSYTTDTITIDNTDNLQNLFLENSIILLVLNNDIVIEKKVLSATYSDNLNVITLNTTSPNTGLSEGQIPRTLILMGTDNPLVIGVNSMTTTGAQMGLLPRGITIDEYNPSSNLPRVFLGDLESIGKTGYGLYSNNVYLNGSLTTKSITGKYAGVNTISGVKMLNKYTTAGGIGESESPIIFWAGAQDESAQAVQNSLFQISENGKLYAQSAYFDDTVFTNGTIRGANIYAVNIYGTDSNNALNIFDAGSNGGIYFKKLVSETPVSVYKINETGMYLEYNSSIKPFIEIDDGSVSFSGEVLNINGASYKTKIEDGNIQIVSLAESNNIYSFIKLYNSTNVGGEITLGTGTTSKIKITEDQNLFNNNSNRLNNNILFDSAMEYRVVIEDNVQVGYDLYVNN